LEREYVAASVLRFMDSPAEQEVRRAYHAILNGKSVDLAGFGDGVGGAAVVVCLKTGFIVPLVT
jgi:hypothetical protein